MVKKVFSGFVVFNVLFALFLNIKGLYSTSMQVDAFFHVLAGKVVYVDPGHGGWDNGTKGDDVLEDEINLLIATLLYEKLHVLGAIPYISRIGDYDLANIYAKNRKDQDMQRRIGYINSIVPDAFISIHLNHYPNASVSGAQAFYKKGNVNAQKLASSVQSELNKLNKKAKTAKVGDYYLTNNSIYAGIIIECGFLSNLNERKNLVSSAHQNALVDKIIDGLALYFSSSAQL